VSNSRNFKGKCRLTSKGQAFQNKWTSTWIITLEEVDTLLLRRIVFVILCVVYCFECVYVLFCVLYYHSHRVHTHLQLIIIVIITNTKQQNFIRP
jgi:hypothetical protein